MKIYPPLPGKTTGGGANFVHKTPPKNGYPKVAWAGRLKERPPYSSRFGVYLTRRGFDESRKKVCTSKVMSAMVR